MRSEGKEVEVKRGHTHPHTHTYTQVKVEALCRLKGKERKREQLSPLSDLGSVLRSPHALTCSILSVIIHRDVHKLTQNNE